MDKNVFQSRLEVLLDYVLHTPEDGLRSAASVMQRSELIRRNLDYLNNEGN